MPAPSFPHPTHARIAVSTQRQQYQAQKVMVSSGNGAGASPTNSTQQAGPSTRRTLAVSAARPDSAHRRLTQQSPAGRAAVQALDRPAAAAGGGAGAAAAAAADLAAGTSVVPPAQAPGTGQTDVLSYEASIELKNTSRLHMNHGYVKEYFFDWDGNAPLHVDVRVEVNGVMRGVPPRKACITRYLGQKTCAYRVNGCGRLQGLYHCGWRLVKQAGSQPYLVLVASRTPVRRLAQPSHRPAPAVGQRYTMRKNEVAYLFPGMQVEDVCFGLVVDVDGTVNEQHASSCCGLSYRNGTTSILRAPAPPQGPPGGVMRNLGYVPLPDKDGTTQLKVVLSTTSSQRLPQPPTNQQQGHGSESDPDSDSHTGSESSDSDSDSEPHPMGGRGADAAAALGTGGRAPERLASVQRILQLSCTGQQGLRQAVGTRRVPPLMHAPKGAVVHAPAPMPERMQAACSVADGSITGGLQPRQERMEDTAAQPLAPVTGQAQLHTPAAAGGNSHPVTGAAGAAVAGRKRNRPAPSMPAEGKGKAEKRRATAQTAAVQGGAAATASPHAGQQAGRQQGAGAAGSSGRGAAAESAGLVQQQSTSVDTAADSAVHKLEAVLAVQQQAEEEDKQLAKALDRGFTSRDHTPYRLFSQQQEARQTIENTASYMPGLLQVAEARAQERRRKRQAAMLPPQAASLAGPHQAQTAVLPPAPAAAAVPSAAPAPAAGVPIGPSVAPSPLPSAALPVVQQPAAAGLAVSGAAVGLPAAAHAKELPEANSSRPQAAGAKGHAREAAPAMTSPIATVSVGQTSAALPAAGPAQAAAAPPAAPPPAVAVVGSAQAAPAPMPAGGPGTGLLLHLVGQQEQLLQIVQQQQQQQQQVNQQVQQQLQVLQQQQQQKQQTHQEMQQQQLQLLQQLAAAVARQEAQPEGSKRKRD